MKERRYPRPGDVLRWKHPTDSVYDHRWKVLGVHLGGKNEETGRFTESLIHVENVSHEPGWTGEWETQVAMYIPDCLLWQCEVECQEPR